MWRRDELAGLDSLVDSRRAKSRKTDHDRGTGKEDLDSEPPKCVICENKRKFIHGQQTDISWFEAEATRCQQCTGSCEGRERTG